MRWDQLEGVWDQVKGSLRAKWGRLTEEDVAAIAAKRDILVKKLQQRYDLLKHRAAKKADEWIAGLSSDVVQPGRDSPRSARGNSPSSIRERAAPNSKGPLR